MFARPAFAVPLLIVAVLFNTSAFADKDVSPIDMTLLLTPPNKKNGIFHEKMIISTTVIVEIFRARLLTVILAQGVITQELINMLMTWNHNSGFNFHTWGGIDGSDGDAIENVARYMRRAAIPVERVEPFARGNSIFSIKNLTTGPR